jgi:hypothetical protein
VGEEVEGVAVDQAAGPVANAALGGGGDGRPVDVHVVAHLALQLVHRLEALAVSRVGDERRTDVERDALGVQLAHQRRGRGGQRCLLLRAHERVSE